MRKIMNDSQSTLFERAVFSSRPNSQSDPKQSLNMTWFLVKQRYTFLSHWYSGRVKAHCEMTTRLCNHKSRKTLWVTHCSQATNKSMPQSRPASAHGQVLIKKLLDLCSAHKGNELSPSPWPGCWGTWGLVLLISMLTIWENEAWKGGEKNATVKSAGMTDYKKWQCEVALTLIKTFWFYLLTAIKTTRLIHCTTSSTLQSSPHTAC